MKKGSTTKILFITLVLNFSVFASTLAVIDLSTIFEKDRKVSLNASGYIRRIIHEDSLFKVLNKKQTYSILTEQQFQFSKDCEDISCDVKKGILLGVDFLITGAINSIDNNYFMVLKLVDMSKEELVGMVSKDIPKSTVTNMKQIVNELVFALLYDKEDLKKKPHNWDPQSKLNSIVINTKPDNATILLNGVEAGVTPYQNDRILSGKYEIEIKKSNYTPISDAFNLTGKATFKDSYELKYTEYYKDSLRHEFFTHKGARNSRRIVFGIASALSAGAGLLFEYLATEEGKNAEKYVAEYSIATADFEFYKDKYKKAESAFNKNVKYRNICYGVSGGMLLGLFISIPF